MDDYISTEIERYLDKLERSLMGLGDGAREEIVREVRSHLEEAAAELCQGGHNPDEGVTLAIARFGEAHEIGRAMRQAYGDPANEAVLSALLPVALTMLFKWIFLPLLRGIGGWQGNPTPVVVASLALLALLIPGLTMRRWRYGYAAWAFFSLISVAQTQM